MLRPDHLLHWGFVLLAISKMPPVAPFSDLPELAAGSGKALYPKFFVRPALSAALFSSEGVAYRHDVDRVCEQVPISFGTPRGDVRM
jgi:hypothetical protein